MLRIVQLENHGVRRVARVEEPHLHFLEGVVSVYELAQRALVSGTSLSEQVARHTRGELVAYDPVYRGESAWRLLSPIDHPSEPARILVSGTGLTHLGSAKNRNAMHGANEAALTDSMRMFRSGLEGGRPSPGQIGTAPEWFYKGNGTILRAPNEPLLVPPFAEDGGEEAEIVGVYVIDATGKPRRLGMAIGNEFSDHKFEKTNYLNLAGSKVRTCSIGPELVIAPDFRQVRGVVSIERAGQVLWTSEVATGEMEMCHSLANIEHHHFKFDTHRRPGDLHVHYYGAHSLSFGAGVQLADGDVMSIAFAGFGRPLRNPLTVLPRSAEPVTVEPLL